MVVRLGCADDVSCSDLSRNMIAVIILGDLSNLLNLRRLYGMSCACAVFDAMQGLELQRHCSVAGLCVRRAPPCILHVRCPHAVDLMSSDQESEQQSHPAHRARQLRGSGRAPRAVCLTDRLISADMHSILDNNPLADLSAQHLFSRVSGLATLYVAVVGVD